MEPPTVTSTSRERRWREEAAFFDDVARRMDAASLLIDPLALRRYSSPTLRRRFNKEFRFRILGPLNKKSILDVGCGDGLNAVMFAKMGARVTGIDVSAKAIEVARNRAKVNAVQDRVSFVSSPVETADFADHSFDVVWGDAFLHHVIDDLKVVISRLTRWAKPEGIVIFSEPVNLFEPLRRLREILPIPLEGTPDERPLVRAEIEIIRHSIPDLRRRHYHLFGRLDRFILANFNYERSPAIWRAIVSCVDLVDYALLSLPLLKNLAGTCVMYGRPRKMGGGLA